MSRPLKIDAHQHFWQLARGDYGWLTPELAPIYRDFMPDDLSPLLDHAGIDGTILVQAAPTLEETQFLLSLAEKHDFILGVVGWINFEADDAATQIAALAQHPSLVGLRPMIQDIPDTTWMLTPKLAAAFGAMIEHDLAFDALVLPDHLPHLLTLLKRYPTLRTVIDHGAKPQIRHGQLTEWAKDIAALAEETSAFCKLSGLVTEADASQTLSDLRPYCDHLIHAFGPERLIWGSDWPVCTMVTSYLEWYRGTVELMRTLSEEQEMSLFGRNAQSFYKLGPGPAPV